MANPSFSATIGAWAAKVKEAQEAIFKGAAQELVKQLNEEISKLIYDQPETPNYKRTGFLRASLMASTSEMPRSSAPNPGGTVQPEFGQIELVINDAELGDTIYLGYTAAYGPYVHYGANGMPPRPWVTLVAQRWQAIVDRKAAEVKAAFGL